MSRRFPGTWHCARKDDIRTLSQQPEQKPLTQECLTV
ncbi:hypothetical protein SPAB_03009 [Salmonella enterica subsp. enterica serovar Paratyphi B str. SPB7]|uniref:Uncharacterized protein n=1 Tax=Salmonella paratyphi B (strain ATCC BAA-1250 / SPB7) TaxID=1016998 RepID=A0A6C6Z3R5_SALPB|nr:hypothetical protein SPAB_03009 [Salmonella enterica subsp. enterica serovar Paratyphi B str. SPB7]